MLKSKLLVGVVGITILLVPQQLSNGKTVSEFMETDIKTRTTEERKTETNEIKLRSVEPQVAFVSIQQENVVEVIEELYEEIKCELTFYTDLYSCNGSDNKLTASGTILNSKTVAVPRKKGSTKPVFQFGTKIVIEGIGERIVEDTGNPKYLKIKEDGTYILDVYVPRNKWEKDKAYKKRVLEMGRVTTTAKVYIDKED